MEVVPNNVITITPPVRVELANDLTLGELLHALGPKYIAQATNRNSVRIAHAPKESEQQK